MDDTKTTYDAAADLIHLIAKVSTILGPSHFRAPAIRMVLDLFVAEGAKQLISVSSLSIASGVPLTTALRHMEAMERAGIITRHDNPSDRRVAHLALTPDVSAQLHALFSTERKPKPQLRNQLAQMNHWPLLSD